MQNTYINGTTFSHDEIVSFKSAEVMNVIETIQFLNENANRNASLAFLSRYIGEVEGIEGHMEAFISTIAAFGDDDDMFVEGDMPGEKIENWTFSRRGYALKGFDFARNLIETAYETDKPLGPIIDRRMRAISELYIGKYLPAIAYEALFEVVDGGKYFSQPKGFLKNVLVDKEFLKFGVNATEPRNHYRAIANATLGISVEDIHYFLDYLGQYSDINESDVVLVGQRLTLTQLESALVDNATIDQFNQRLVPSYSIAGLSYVVDRMFPKNILAFWNEQASEIIKKLVSPKADLRGIALAKQDKFGKNLFTWDVSPEIFNGAKVRIMPEGYHVTGRHHVMLVDLKPIHDWAVVNTEIVAQKALANPLYAGLTAGTVNSAIDDAARAAARTAYLELRLMQANGYAAISGHRKTLRGSWYNQKA